MLGLFSEYSLMMGPFSEYDVGTQAMLGLFSEHYCPCSSKSEPIGGRLIHGAMLQSL